MVSAIDFDKVIQRDQEEIKEGKTWRINETKIASIGLFL